MIPMLVYTHSDYDNVYELWWKQTKKYMSDAPIYLMSDKDLGGADYFFKYHSGLPYTNRVLECLEYMKHAYEDVVIFQHEDMMLYEQPDINVLNELVSLVQSDTLDMIRLIRVVPELNPTGIHPSLYWNPNNNLFSIQPTIIKIKNLYQLFLKGAGLNIWNFERYCEERIRGYKSAFTYTNENKRGLYHYDSNIFPYIATAVNKGEWNMNEYSTELTKLFNEHGIQ